MAAMIDVILYHFILMLFNNGTKDIAIRAQKNVYALPKRTRAAFTYESASVAICHVSRHYEWRVWRAAFHDYAQLVFRKL